MSMIFILCFFVVVVGALHTTAIETSDQTDDSTDDNCVTTCRFSFSDPVAGCCHRTTDCCFLDNTGEGSCRSSSFCSSHCSAFYACSDGLFCSNGLCVTAPTQLPTPVSISFAPTQEPIASYSRLDDQTDDGCSGTTCRYSYNNPDAGCCQHANDCCFYDDAGNGSCKPSSYCSAHCSAYYPCSDDMVCIIGQCVVDPTQFPTLMPTSYAPVVQPMTLNSHFGYTLHHEEIVGLWFAGCCLALIGILFIKDGQYIEFIRVAFASADFISDIFFVLMVQHNMDAIGNKDGEEYLFTQRVYCASIAFLVISCCINLFFLVTGTPSVFRATLPTPAEICCDLEKFADSLWSTLEVWKNQKEMAAILWVISIPHHIVVVLFILLLFPLSFIALVLYMFAAYLMEFLLNAIIFVSAVTNSEINHHFYGRPGDKKNYLAMTVSGILAEDVTQVIIQLVYAVISYRYYSVRISRLQMVSFALTAYRLVGELLWKVLSYDKDPPKREGDRSNSSSSKTLAGVSFELVDMVGNFS